MYAIFYLRNRVDTNTLTVSSMVKRTLEGTAKTFEAKVEKYTETPYFIAPKAELQRSRKAQQTLKLYCKK